MNRTGANTVPCGAPVLLTGVREAVLQSDGTAALSDSLYPGYKVSIHTDLQLPETECC